jgi:FTR1 family protein
MTLDGTLVADAVNPAVVVVREGIEAVLIVAALTASFRSRADRRLRLALWSGVGVAALLSVATWGVAATLLTSLRFFGQALDAVVSLVSVAILLLITNWFFHRVYWTGWVSGFHARKRRWLDAGTGQLAGMVILGFTSTYREGFETVLFLQTLGLQGASGSIGLGLLMGLVVVVLVGLVVLGLQLRLPHRKMLVATGLMISLVLVVMVGNTVVLLQKLSWTSVHPLPFTLPTWTGLWLGLHATVEGVLAQVAAATFVFGSYWLAERYQRGPEARRAAWQRVAVVGALLVALVGGWTGSTMAQQPQAPLQFRTRIDAAVSDPAVALLPDCASGCSQRGSAGGALDFVIPNDADTPVQVVSVEPMRYGCPDTYGQAVVCDSAFTSDRNADGTAAAAGASGDCWAYVHFRTQDLSQWPSIAARSKLAVRGNDAEELGLHFIHLDSGAPAPCVHASYQIKLYVILQSIPQGRSYPTTVGSPAAPSIDLGAGS